MGKMILIAAVTDEGIIGNNGKIPWREDPEFKTAIGEDMDRFRKLTTGHAVIMGRRTYDTLGKPLKDRLNVVVTRNQDYQNNQDGVIVCGTIEEAIERAKGFRKDERFYVIGGEEVYRQTIGRANELQITHIRRLYEGDSRFPEIDSEIWERIESGERYEFEFARYVRKVS